MFGTCTYLFKCTLCGKRVEEECLQTEVVYREVIYRCSDCLEAHGPVVPQSMYNYLQDDCGEDD